MLFCTLIFLINYFTLWVGFEEDDINDRISFVLDVVRAAGLSILVQKAF